MADPACDHPESSLRYLEPADAVAELIKRHGYNQLFIDVIQSAHPDDDVDVELRLLCGELLFLMPDDDTRRTGLRRVWLATDKGKGIESSQSPEGTDMDERACDHAAVNKPLTLADAIAALLAQPDRPGESRRAHDGIHQASSPCSSRARLRASARAPYARRSSFGPPMLAMRGRTRSGRTRSDAELIDSEVDEEDPDRPCPRRASTKSPGGGTTARKRSDSLSRR